MPATPTAADPDRPLPVLFVDAPSDRIVQKLGEAAKRGRMAGFARGEGDVLFKTSAFSAPFDGELDARTGSVQSGGTELRFTPRLKKPLIWVYIAVLLVSIWPGLPITQSLLASMVPSWHWLWSTTAYWYLPLSVIGAPWALWSALKKSKTELAVSAWEMVGKIEKELGAKRIAG